jgi:hypothetical protein
VISDAENNYICSIPDESEIRKVISQLGLTKALGPDGFTGLFFQNLLENNLYQCHSFSLEFFPEWFSPQRV